MPKLINENTWEDFRPALGDESRTKPTGVLPGSFMIHSLHILQVNIS